MTIWRPADGAQLKLTARFYQCASTQRWDATTRSQMLSCYVFGVPNYVASIYAGSALLFVTLASGFNLIIFNSEVSNYSETTMLLVYFLVFKTCIG